MSSSSSWTTMLIPAIQWRRSFTSLLITYSRLLDSYMVLDITPPLLGILFVVFLSCSAHCLGCSFPPLIKGSEGRGALDIKSAPP